MAYKLGVANGYLDLLYVLHKFLTSANKVVDPVYAGGNTGKGYVSAEWSDDSSGIVQDVWTLTYVEDTGGDYWTVEGASYGVQSAVAYTSNPTLEINLPYVSDNGEIGFTIIQGTPNWAGGDVITLTVDDGQVEVQKWETNRYNMVYDSDIENDASNTGNGSIGNPNYDMYAPEETWTITMLTATTFSVVGSVQGAKANGSTGVAYDNGFISFTLSVGAVAWVVDDFITVDVPEQREVMWQAPGNGGTEEIYSGVQTFYAAGSPPIYQWLLQGYTAFDPDATFHTQPSAVPYPNFDIPRIVQQNRNMPYWIVANGRRVCMFYEVEGVYECMYLGFILPYGNPIEQPYPFMIGGTTAYETIAHSDESDYHRSFWDGPAASYSINRTTCRIWNGTSWSKIWSTGNGGYLNYGRLENCGPTWPFVSSAQDNANINDTWFYMDLPNFDGSYSFYPIIPNQWLPARICFGEIHGVYAIPGEGTNAEDVIDIGGTLYVIFKNTWRADTWSKCVLKLE